MAHYAFLDTNNIVVDVIVGIDDDTDGINWEQRYTEIRGSVCKRTSYNTHGGIHYNPSTNKPNTDQSKAFRKNYAGIGFIYNQNIDAFIPPQPYPSWVLDIKSCLWQAPVPYPFDGKIYIWNESTQSWDLSV